jgi:methylmalonyl-CoA mutase
MPKLRIEEASAKKQARIDAGEDVIVGVNKYRLKEEEEVDVLKIDNSAVRASQIAKLADIRASRDEDEVCRLLAILEAAAKTSLTSTKRENLLTVAIDCAKARCTVGEISSAMENGFGGRYTPTNSVVSGAYQSSYTNKDDFKQVSDRIERFEHDHGRRPRILVAKMGQDGHDRGAKVVASGFADLGFDVDIGPLFQTPEEVVQQAMDADVHVIGISSQAAGHNTLVPKLSKILQEAGAGHILMVCGGVIPKQDYAFLLENGCCAIFGPGTSVPVAAMQVIEKVDEALVESGRS